MPARKLESYVNKGIQEGSGIESIKIAETLFQVASRNEVVPLYLPLGKTAIILIQAKLQQRLQDLEAVRHLSAID